MPSSVTWPMTTASRSHLAKTSMTSVLGAGARDDQHALLRLGEQDLVRRQIGLALRHLVEIDGDAEAAARRHLDRRAGQAGGAHVLDGDDRVALHQLEAGLDQQLLGERIADLHGRPLLLRGARRTPPTRAGWRRGCRRGRSSSRRR